MKKIFWILITFAILSTACVSNRNNTPVLTATMQNQSALPTHVFDEFSQSYVDLVGGVVTPRPTSCRIISLNDREENVPRGTYVPDMSFTQEAANTSPSQYDSPSVNNETTLGKTEIDLLISKNKDASGNWIHKSYQWAATGYIGAYYQEIPGYSIYDRINWNWVVPASPNPHDRNFICVDAKVGNYYEIVAAPKMSNYDSVTSLYWLNYKVAANYRACSDPATCNMGEDLWNGFLFAPDTFPTTKGNKGFWTEEKYVHTVTDTLVQIPWLQTVTPTPTPTFTPTETSTPTPTVPPTLTPSPTPIPSKPFMCLKSTWPLQLHQRPGPTMGNIPNNTSVDPGGIVALEGLLVNPEGEWGQVNPWTYFAISLNPTIQHPIKRTFAVQTACP